MSGNANFQISRGLVTKDNGVVISTRAFAGNNSRPDCNPEHIQGLNNPNYCSLHNIGPMPTGIYRIHAWGTFPEIGPNAAALEQIGGESYGRSGFYIHGPALNDPMNSSKGCLVIPHDDRMAFIACGFDTLTVTA